MSMREFKTETSFGSDQFNRKIRVYGDIHYRGVSMNRRQKERIEREVCSWIDAHSHLELSDDEIQYWVTFSKSDSGKTVNCRVELLGERKIWESSEFSTEPLRAFQHCLAELSPTSLSQAS